MVSIKMPEAKAQTARHELIHASWEFPTNISHPRVAARRAAVEALATVKIGQFEGGYGTNHVTKLLPVKAEESQAIEKINRGERI